MNAAWHREHVLEKGSDKETRLAWHIAHQRACACRTMPAELEAEARKRGLL